MRKTLFIFCVTLFFSDLFAQAPINHMNNYYPPSPEAASLIDKNASYSVDYYTGRLNYSIPLFSTNIVGVKLDIGLRYATSGFKVQEIAGSVGLGWNLNAGGVITRYVEGLPDDDVNGYCGINNIGEKTGNTYNDEFFKKITNGDWDSQPDKFYITCLGKSAVFRLDEDGQPIMSSSESGLKIEYSPFNRVNGRANSGPEEWIVSDQSGNRYFFGREWIETTTSRANKREGGTTDKTFISSWFLKEVKTFYNQNLVFHYVKGNTVSYDYYVNTRSYILTQGACSIDKPELLGNENVNISISEPLYLNAIFSNSIEAGYFSISFSYENRTDLTNARKLTGIQVGNKKISLKYGYFYSNDGSGTSRLKLIGINEEAISAETIKLYQFTYHEQSILPARNSIRTDYWGYYNKNQGTSNIEGYGNSDKSPFFDFTKSCALVKVLNHLGGSVNFDYEPNTYKDGSSNKVGAGIRIKRKFEKVLNSPNGEETLLEEYSYMDENNQFSSGQVYLKPQLSELLSYAMLIGAVNGLPYPCVLTFSNKYSQPLVSLFDLNEVSVGYSRVSIKDKKGYKVFSFSNFSDQSDELETAQFGTLGQAISTTFKPQFQSTSYAFMRGKVKSLELLDIDENKVHSTVYIYTLSQSPNNIVGVKAYPYISSGDNISYHYGKYYYFNAEHMVSFKTSTIFKSGTSTNQVTESFAYNNVHKNLISSKEITDFSGRIVKESFAYPFENLSDPIMILMTEKNKISEPFKTEKFVNGNLVNQEIWEYTSWHSDPKKIIAPVRISQKIGTSPLETILNFNAYDNFGNVVEINKPNGRPQTFLWGYNGQYMVGKIDGANYDDVVAQINPRILTVTRYFNDEQILSELDKIRVGLPKSQVTSYTYSPNIGMTSQVSPNGTVIKYEYDLFGRLRNIKDSNGSIVKSYQYHTVNLEPNWVNTGLNTGCDTVVDPDYDNQPVNTGYVSVEQKDINPNSATYNQIRRVPDLNNTSVVCPASYYFSYSTDAYMAQVSIRAKRSYDDTTTKTMRFRVRHDSVTGGSQTFEQIVDIVISSENQNVGQEWLFVNAATYLEVELLDVF